MTTVLSLEQLAADAGRELEDASAEEVLSRIHAAVGIVEPVDENTCVLITGAESLEVVAVYIGMLGLDFHVTAPPALVQHLNLIGERYLRASAPIT